MTGLPIELDQDSNVNLYDQLAGSLREQINAGLIVSGAKLPSIRELTAQLGISKKTVSRSYEILRNQGWISIAQGKSAVASRPRQNETTRGSSAALPRKIKTSALSKQLAMTKPVQIIVAFRANAPAVKDLPFDQWRRCLIAHVGESSPALSPERDPFGHILLRSTIKSYVERLHSVSCDESDIAILPEARLGIELIARLFLNPGDNVVVESPGSRWASRIFLAYGARIVPVPIDDDGLCVDQLECFDKL